MKSFFVFVSFFLYFGLNTVQGVLIFKNTSFYEIKFCSEYWTSNKKPQVLSSHNFSIWKPSTIEDGFFPLGDVLSLDSNNQPNIQSVMVLSDFTESPKEMSCTDLIFDDPSAGKICQLIPASKSYRCLGDIFQSEGSEKPPPEYRCVHQDFAPLYKLDSYLWEFQTMLARLTRNGHIQSFWGVPRNLERPEMLKVGTFISSPNEKRPDLYYLNKKGNLTQNSFPVFQSLVVSDTQDFELIHTYTVVKRVNRSSPIVKSPLVAFWRLSNTTCCSLGDVVQLSNHGNMRITIRQGDYSHRVDQNVKPYGGLINEYHDPPLETILSVPKDFQEVWTNPVAGLALEVQAYTPVCQEGYVAMGVFFTRRDDPSALHDLARRARCVNNSYVVPARWSLIWTDSHHSSSSATLWQMQPETSQSTSALHIPTFATPALRTGGESKIRIRSMLNKSLVTYLPEIKIIKSIEIRDVVMDQNDEDAVTEDLVKWSTGLKYNNCHHDNQSKHFQGEIKAKIESGEVWTVSIPKLISNPTTVSLVYEKSIGFNFNINSGGQHLKKIKTEYRTKMFQASPIKLEPNITAEVWGRASKRTEHFSWEGTATYVFDDGTESEVLTVVGKRMIVDYTNFSTETVVDKCSFENIAPVVSMISNDPEFSIASSNPLVSVDPVSTVVSSPAAYNKASIITHLIALLILLLHPRNTMEF